MANWRDRIAALLGVSAYEAPIIAGKSLDDPDVEQARARLGGQLTPFPITQTRWFLADLERAQQAADQGDLSFAARLYRSMRSDGVFAGHLSSRTGKAVRLPKRFSGDPEIVSTLQGRDGVRSVFDDMFPPSELEQLADDGLVLGVGVAEMMPVKGRAYPVMVRLEPEWLRYRWSENRWYYQSTAGQLPITPGDGRWILHAAGGRMSPWQRGLWNPCGRAFIGKSHAELHQANWEAKLANPARAATAALGASEDQRKGFMQRLIAWGVNTVFELPPGWDVKLIESNGRGYESFGDTIDRAEYTYAISICGQVVTTTGGSGFGNADVPERVLTALVDATADAIAYTINTQGTPQYIVDVFGADALERMAVLELATKPAKDLSAQAQTLISVTSGIKALREELAHYGRAPDVAEIATEFAIPIAGDIDGDGTPDPEGKKGNGFQVQTPPPDTKIDSKEIVALVDVAKSVGLRLTQASVSALLAGVGLATEAAPSGNTPVSKLTLTPSGIEKIVRVNEGRASEGLPPDPGPDGNLYIAQVAPTPPGGAAPATAEAAPATAAPSSAPAAMPAPVPDEMAPPTDESASTLAAKMTEHGIPKCEHGSINRCRLCGIERTRDFDKGPDGTASWKVAWRPIPKSRSMELIHPAAVRAAQERDEHGRFGGSDGTGGEDDNNNEQGRHDEAREVAAEEAKDASKAAKSADRAAAKASAKADRDTGRSEAARAEAEASEKRVVEVKKEVESADEHRQAAEDASASAEADRDQAAEDLKSVHGDEDSTPEDIKKAETDHADAEKAAEQAKQASDAADARHAEAEAAYAKAEADAERASDRAETAESKAADSKDSEEDAAREARDAHLEAGLHADHVDILKVSPEEARAKLAQRDEAAQKDLSYRGAALEVAKRKSEESWEELSANRDDEKANANYIARGAALEAVKEAANRAHTAAEFWASAHEEAEGRK